MNNDLRLAPLRFSSLTPPDILAERLRPLIGVEFQLSMFPRTNGSKIRKLIVETLEQYPLPEPCPRQLYTVVPLKGKGVPRILRKYIDTYIVTTGRQYNLQVWNRNPTGQAALIEYASGDKLAAKDVRYLIALVSKDTGIIEGLVLCPGKRLGDHFSYVSDSNYKCQRGIPMSFFDRYDGLSVYNP